jgi:DsbC/DsbD-like thiol-disulfide interchange protein
MRRLTFCAVVSVAVAAAVVMAAGRADAQSSRRASTPHVTVELIADSDAIAQRGSVWLGFRFELDPLWHIYWQNPGDSGGPPQVTWKLPPGFSAGPIQWPAPQRIDSEGIISYGYRGAAVLPVELSFARQGPAPGTVRIGASLKWLICKDMCVPGKATLELALPVTGDDRAMVPTWRAALTGARSLVPPPAPPTWKGTARLVAGSFVIDIVTGESPATGVFFPFDAGQMEDTGVPDVSPIRGGLRFKLRRADQLAKDPPALKGVVSLPDGRAFLVTVPVVSPAG